ncbi:MAG TPA: hypothetical protein VNK04_01290 [Gemmataceae bacterium]|nr:hypothetical protein [Gemmataceae bacterium]
MRSGLLGAVLLGAVLASGCDRGPSLGTVNGEVTLDGEPIKDGAITFEPVAGDTPTAGATIQDGKFTAQVPVGKHRVKISASKPTGKKYRAYDTPDSPVVDEVMEIIPAVYNTKSKLTIEVQSGTQTVEYALKSKPPF